MADPDRWRRGENFAAIRTYERLGIPIYDMVTAGTFEGGDCDVIEEGCVLIGCGGARTQEDGARQVESWFRQEGWETRLAFIDEYYVHIDLMVVPIAPKLTAVCSKHPISAYTRRRWLRSNRWQAGSIGHFGNTRCHPDNREVLLKPNRRADRPHMSRKHR